MIKVIAILNVVAWSGFWAFGYLALSASSVDTNQMVMAAILAACGAALGLWAWFRLVRYSEATGYARPAKRALALHEDITKGENA